MEGDECYVCQDGTPPLLSNICACKTAKVHAECLDRLVAYALEENPDMTAYQCTVCLRDVRVDQTLPRALAPHQALRHAPDDSIGVAFMLVASGCFIVLFARTHAPQVETLVMVGFSTGMILMGLVVCVVRGARSCCALCVDPPGHADFTIRV